MVALSRPPLGAQPTMAALVVHHRQRMVDLRMAEPLAMVVLVVHHRQQRMVHQHTLDTEAHTGRTHQKGEKTK